MKNFLLESQQKAENINQLTEFIQENKDPRELKRALAVKMALLGKPYSQISNLLGMHFSSITSWKQRFTAQGLKGIKLGYQGSKSYLKLKNRAEVIRWLKTRTY